MSGLTSSSCVGTCSAGYACAAGSVNSTTSICPAGQYCPAGSPAPVPCPPGVQVFNGCPCGGLQPLSLCCRPVHQSARPHPEPLAQRTLTGTRTRPHMHSCSHAHASAPPRAIFPPLPPVTPSHTPSTHTLSTCPALA
jgi:hypothetical protein